MAGKLKYRTVEEFDKAIEEYFALCDGHILEDKDGNPVLDKWGQPVIVGDEVPSITGLALHLGFESRRGMLNYKYRKAFFPAYARALARCEKYEVERLHDKDGFQGAKYVLEHCHGWEKETAGESEGVKIIDDI